MESSRYSPFRPITPWLLPASSTTSMVSGGAKRRWWRLDKLRLALGTPGIMLLPVINLLVLCMLWGQRDRLSNCIYSPQSLHLTSIPRYEDASQPVLLPVDPSMPSSFDPKALPPGDRGLLVPDMSNWSREEEERNRTRSVIGVLTDTFGEQLQLLIENVDLYFLDDRATPLLLFHTHYPLDEAVEQLRKMTKRPIELVNVDTPFNAFPKGFNPYEEQSIKRFTHRGKWAYNHMIRFWFKDVFELPALADVKYLMRLDVDSRLSAPWQQNVFEVMDKQEAVYWANQVIYDVEWVTPGIKQLRNFSQEYYTQHNMTAANLPVWEVTFAEEGNSCRGYFNNFEINRVSFFRRPDVLQWVQAVDESLGIFRYRWGDAILRHMTLAFFAQGNEILETDYDWKLPYCHPWPYMCPEIK